MFHRGPDAIEPAAFVAGLRRREGRAGKLLGIKPVWQPLGRVAANRQRARQGFGLERISEAGHVSGTESLLPLSGFQTGLALDVHDDLRSGCNGPENAKTKL